MTRDAGVVIVGGGPAGTATALAIARRSPALAARTVLLERATYPRDKPCAGALSARGDALLAALGVTIDVPSVPIDGMSLRTASGEAAASPGRIGRVIRRLEFDHALAKAAAAAGVEVRDGVQVTAIHDEGESAVVETHRGTWRAKAVVGCDGVGSIARRTLGAPAGRLRAQVIEVDTDPVGGDRARTLLHFDTTDRRLHGYAWDFPTIVSGRLQVCRGVYHLKTSDDGVEVADLLADRLLSLGIEPTVLKNKRYAERGYEPAAVLAKGAILLAGEAAGIDAVTGEGIAQAIEYGVEAGAFVTEALTEDKPLSTWPTELARTRLTRDLKIRHTLLPLYYGPTRAAIERALTETPEALHIGAEHFAARSPDWLRVTEVLAGTAAHLAAAKIHQLLA